MANYNAITTPTLVINNIPISFVPNTLEYTEGKGEQSMKTASSGGGAVDIVYADDVKTHLSMVKFQVFPVIDSIENIRLWKSNLSANTITITDQNPDGTFTRTFNFSALCNDPPIKVGADKEIDIEFRSAQAV